MFTAAAARQQGELIIGTAEPYKQAAVGRRIIDHMSNRV
jgi:hypothetical protein